MTVAPLGLAIPTDAEKLAGLLRARRAQLGLSQGQVAARAGCHVTQISRVERGETRPSSTMLLRHASALNLYLALIPIPD